MNNEAAPGDQQQQQHRKLVNVQIDVDRQTADIEQSIKGNRDRSAGGNTDESAYRKSQSETDRGRAYFVTCLAKKPSPEGEN